MHIIISKHAYPYSKHAYPYSKHAYPHTKHAYPHLQTCISSSPNMHIPFEDMFEKILYQNKKIVPH